MDAIVNVIREFVSTNFFVTDPSQLGDDASLIDNGIIDSTGTLEVIAFLEQRFDIRVQDPDIRPANFDSIEKLTAYVKRRLMGSQAPLPG